MNASSQNCVKVALRSGVLVAAAMYAAYGQTTLINLGSQGRNVDFSNAPSTRPMKTGTAFPATCSAGDLFFKTDAPAGQNIFGCSATNTWTAQGATTGLNDPGTNGVVVRTGTNTAMTVTAPTGALVGTTDAQTLTNKSIDASQMTGTLPTRLLPAFSGDLTTAAGSTATTLSTVNSTPGTFGDSTHAVQLTVDGKGRITSVTQTALSAGNQSSAAVVSSGMLASIPNSCTAGTLYLATDQPAGQQLYSCSATNTWSSPFTVGPSGALSFTNDTLDINSVIVPAKAAANVFTGANTFTNANTFSGANTFTAANSFTGSNSFGGTTTVTNLTVTGTCTGCGSGTTNTSQASATTYLPFAYGKAFSSAACSSSDSILIDSTTIPSGTLNVGDLVEINAVIKANGSINSGNGTQYVRIAFGSSGSFPANNQQNFQLPNGGSYLTQSEKIFVTGSASQLPFGIFQFLSGNYAQPHYSAPSDSPQGTWTEAGVPSESISGAITVGLYLQGCSVGGGGNVSGSWHIKVTK